MEHISVISEKPPGSQDFHSREHRLDLPQHLTRIKDCNQLQKSYDDSSPKHQSMVRFLVAL